MQSKNPREFELRSTCACNFIFICCLYLPQRRQMRPGPVQRMGLGVPRVPNPSAKTCDPPLYPRSVFFSWPIFSIGLPRMREMKLQDLKAKTPGELVSFAEELEVENASTMRKQALMFGILKQL